MHNPINPKLLRLYNERSERWKFQHWDSPYGSDVVYYFIVDKQNVLIDWQVTVYDFIFNPKWEFAKLIFGDDYRCGYCHCCTIPQKEYDPNKKCTSCSMTFDTTPDYELHLEWMANDPFTYLENYNLPEDNYE